MQSASVNFVRAATGAGGTWAKPQVQVDWMMDGYDATPSMLDLFQRNLTSSFGNTDTGQSWVNLSSPASAFSVVYDGTNNLTGAYGQHSINTAGAVYHTRESVLSGPLVFVATQTIWLSLPVLPSGDSIECMMLFRRVDTNNYYRAGVVIGTSGAVDLAAIRVTSGVDNPLISASSGVTYAGGSQVLAVRGQLLANGTVRLKAWIEGTPVPTAWQAQATDSGQNQTAGVPGIRTVVYPNNNNTRPVLIRYHRYQVDNGLPDDVSNQAGGWTVEHHLDDGYPDSVTFISGVGFSEAGVDMTPPPAYLTDGIPQRPAEYYSPYNTTSPIYGRDRDVAPVKIDHGLVTASGPERIRVFTGQMQDIPVKNGLARMIATAATRIALSKLVQPPAFSYPSVGLNGSWPVSWALAQCGLYVSPPPRTGCRWWVPMHGSTRPFIPSTNVNLEDATFWQSPKYLAGDVIGASRTWRPTFIDGPFLLAPDCQVTAAEARRTSQLNIEFGAGADILSQAGNAGRLEFWIKGDATDINNAPTGSANYTRIAALRTMSDLVSSRGVHLGVNTSRQAFVYANDGAGHSITLTSTDKLPTDGAWYFVGCAYDVANKKVWLTNFNGSTRSTGWTTAVTSSLPATDDFVDVTYPNWVNHLPVAEVQFSTGAQANVDNYPTWLNAIAFTPDVIMTPSVLELVMVAETEPVEAWEFISRYAQAELAAMRTDELDRFNYLGFGYWVQDAQQVVVDTIGTGVNSEVPDINADPTKIRNSTRVTYNAIEIPGTRIPAYTLSQQLIIPPGTTVFEFTFNKQVVALSDSDILYLTDDDVVNGVTVYANLDYVTLNSETDGAGTFADSGTVTITKTSWHAGAATWTFYNNSATTWYTANTKNVPALQISGYPVANPSAFVTDSDDTSIARRGERALPITGTEAVQNVVDARRLARRLKMGLREPTPITETLEIFGDPRRQPGDLVTFEDPSVTRVSGQWRLQTVSHEYQTSGQGVAYTQQVRLRPVLPICRVGTGIVGQSLIGPDE